MSVDKSAMQERPHLGGAVQILPVIAKSVETFRRNLPDLLKTHYRMWVAYNGEKRIGVAKKQITLYERSQRLGLGQEEFVVCFIEHEPFPDEIEIAYDEIGIRGLSQANLQFKFYWQQQTNSLYQTPWWQRILG